ncbi:MAG: DUF1697 domain-containing protein [Coriobacteriales bacterium]|jgi:uncharacterized protein (DUF1697 family)|nr:DUF1697 domain-containing protein [Coriobacteriales bacterium]
MSVRIALFRGVNVGGKGIISMAELRSAFVDAGFIDAVTYINSGNVLFTSVEKTLTLQASIAQMVSVKFGLQTPVAVISMEELADALAQAPDWWGIDNDDRHNAIFVIPPEKAEAVCAEVGDIKPEYEKLAWYGQLIFWSAPMKTFSKTRWSSVSKYPVYQKLTIRNHRTARKLLELAKQLA